MAQQPRAANQLAKLREKTALEDEGEEILHERELHVGKTDLPTKQKSCPGKSVRVLTNLFPIKMKRAINIHQYRVDIEFNLPSRNGNGGGTSFSPTSATTQGARHADNVKLSRGAFDLIFGANQEIFDARERVYYDGGNQLFALDQFKMDEPSITLTYNADQNLYQLHTRALSVAMTVSTIEGALTLDAFQHIEHATTDTNAEYMPLVQFLEIATSESAARTGDHVVYQNGEVYMIDPTKFGYNVNQNPLDPGMYMAVGARKAVRMIDDDSSDPPRSTPALVIDPRVKPFHSIMIVSEKVRQLFPNIERNPNGSVEQISRHLRGLYVVPIHQEGSVRMIRISGVSSSNARTQIFEREGQPISVLAYYKEKFRIELKHPHLPLLEFKVPIPGTQNPKQYQTNHLPMELYEICDDQPVANVQFIGETQQRVLEASTRPPRTMFDEIQRNANSLQFDQSPHLQQAQVEIGREMIEVGGKILDAPAMIYDPRNPSIYDPNRSTWRPGRKYAVGAQCPLWAIYVLERSNRRSFENPENFARYIDAFMRGCQNMGMVIGEPGEYEILQAPMTHGYDIEVLESKFKIAQEAGCKFLMLITTKADIFIHDALKMYEQKFGIITQNVTSKTAKAAAGIDGPVKRLTMDNIINKTNVKLGGLNYLVGDLEQSSYVGDKDLFIGIGTNHPAGGYRISTKEIHNPSVVGYASNDGALSCEFTGNYVYQEARRDEKLHVIEDIVDECLGRFIKNRGGKPERVFIYRNGCSEGQFPRILRYEVPLVANVILKKHECQAKLVVIITNKLHGTKLVPAKIPTSAVKASEQNLKPGTLVDSGITHPCIQEFYLLGHLGRLGTAKVPRYSVIYNPGAVSIDDIQKITYQLGFAHQIINGTTGLPTPAYVANEYAKRGRNIFNVHSTNSYGNESDSSRANANLTERFSYKNTLMALDQSNMRNYRFNA